MRESHPVALLLLLSWPCALSSAAVERGLVVGDRAIPAHRWDVIDLAFSVGDPPERPAEIEVSATFMSVVGGQNWVAGFSNGGGEYVVRFSPDSAGEWTYRAESALPALDGLAASLSVRDTSHGRRGA